MRHALLLLLAACGGPPNTSPPASGVPSEAPAPEPEEPLAGGWSPADPASDDIQAAGQEVLTLLRERTGDDTLAITAITGARTQVVAGMNYELVVDLTGEDGEKSGVHVVVYRNLQNEWALTSVDGL